METLAMTLHIGAYLVVSGMLIAGAFLHNRHRIP